MLHPCHPSQSTISLRFPCGDQDHDQIILDHQGQGRGLVGLKIAWITQGSGLPRDTISVYISMEFK